MNNRDRRKRVLAIAVPLVLLGLNGWFLYSSLNQLFLASQWVRHTLVVRETLAEIKGDLLNAETGQRGYLLTSERLYLAPYHQAKLELTQRLDRLEPVLSEAPSHRQRLREIRSLVSAKFSELDATIAAMESDGAAAATALVRENRGKIIMDRLRVLVGELQQAEGALLAERQAAYERTRTVALLSFAVLMIAVIALFGVVYWTGRKEFLSTTAATARISEYAASLNQSVARLKQERNEIAMLNEAGNFLQSCDTMDEVGMLAGPFLDRIFPQLSGGLYIYAASRNQLTLLADWGEAPSQDLLHPGECWSIRRGMRHHHSRTNGVPRCCHHGDAGDAVCLPLMAHGEAIGLLSFRCEPQSEGIDDGSLRLADMLAHQLGLTLSNIRLRETLNEQSIRDPLTNAFNRRYLDTVAEKELAQAQRQHEAVAIAMLDIDHFKRFNDLHGHLAGDQALSGVVDYLQKCLRAGDWLFRYGGEEFLIMMRGISPDDARQRFEEMIGGVAELQLSHEDRVLPKVTISVGLAMFPDHEKSFAGLVALADEALYAAKKSGRNRLCIAHGEEPAPLLLSA